MIDINHLGLVAPTTAPPGSFLIQAAKNRMYTGLLTIGGGGPNNALTIDHGRNGFQVVDVRRTSAVFLRIERPRFVVDPESARTGMDSSLEAGTLFLSSAGPGILAKMDFGECRVLLDGTIADDTSYTNFAGFGHWRVEVDGPGVEPQVLFTYRHPGLTD